MSFTATSFVYNKIPCEQFGLTLFYDFDGNTSGSESLSITEIVSDRTNKRLSSFNYGVSYPEPLKGKLVFGVLDNSEEKDRYDLSVIGGWLLGHNQYKWLEICQPDMRWVRYKCLITNLQVIDVAGIVCAFSCDVECDSPFAYTYPQTHIVDVVGKTSLDIYNTSSYNGYVYPYLKFTATDATALKITNTSDNNREFTLSDLSKDMMVEIDNDNKIITSNKTTVNTLYDNFGGDFFRLARGFNNLEITGTGKLEITYNLPMNIGF